jgi:hypothetical protein
METRIEKERDRTWLVALATLSLGLSSAVGHFHGNVIDFVGGFLLGISLAVSFGYLALVFLHRSRS